MTNDVHFYILSITVLYLIFQVMVVDAQRFINKMLFKFLPSVLVIALVLVAFKVI